MREKTKYGSERELDIQKLDIQNTELPIEEDERLVLRNFLQAVHRRLLKKHWTRGETIDFWIRIIYVTVLNAILIYEMESANKKWRWIPNNQLSWILLLYPSTIIVDTIFDYYLVEAIKDEYMPVYSREEQALYQEKLSITKQVPKKLYIPLFILGFVIPAIFSLYASIESTDNLVEITGIPWVDGLLIFFSGLPIYLSYSLLVIRIMGMPILDYSKRWQAWTLRTLFSKENKNVLLQARAALIQQIKISLYQNIKKALIAYRMDPNRSISYQENFNHLSEIENLTDLRQDKIFQHLELLASIVQIKNHAHLSNLNYTNTSSSHVPFKKIFIVIASIAYLMSYLLFEGLGTPAILENNFLGVNNLSHMNTPLLRILDVIANIFGLIPLVIVFTFLFKEMTSLLLNKSLDFFRFFFHRKANISIVIQQHRYLFTLSCVMSTLLIIFTLPFETPFVYSTWVFQGYNQEFDFSHVQHTGKDAFLTFYFPAITILGLLTYPVWRVMTSAFKYLMGYFSNEEQRREIQLEEFIKTWLRLIKACKSDPFLETLRGFSGNQLKQLVFNGKDPESVLEEAYQQKGITTEDDPDYNKIKAELLAIRETQNNQEQGELVECAVESSERESNQEIGSSNQQTHSQNRLSPSETIRLIVEMRKRETAQHEQQRQTQQNENKPLISRQHRPARCTLY